MNASKFASLFQFSVRNLLVAVTILALGIVALLNANELWLGAIWAVQFFALTASILLVVYRRDEKRAFWLGFAVFGGMYLAALLVPRATQAAPWVIPGPQNRPEELITTHLALLAHQHLLPASMREQQIAVPGPPVPTLPPQTLVPVGPSLPEDGATSPPDPLGPATAPVGMPGSAAVPISGGAWVTMAPNPNYVPLPTFTNIFHALCLLLIAAIGGKACQFIYGTRPAT